MNEEEEAEVKVDKEKIGAVQSGAKLIAQFIEPVARSSWMQNTQNVGLAQATSDEDVDKRAIEALLIAMEAQLEPPPPIGQPNGARRWGGMLGSGPAICPLANLVVPPADQIEEAREAKAINALLGRPIRGSVDAAIRCVAAKDLPAGSLIISDVPGAINPLAPPLSRGAAVTITDNGPLSGMVGTVVLLRPLQSGGMMPMVRLEEDQRLVAVPASKLKVQQSEEDDGGNGGEVDDGKRRRVM